MPLVVGARRRADAAPCGDLCDVVGGGGRRAALWRMARPIPRAGRIQAEELAGEHVVGLEDFGRRRGRRRQRRHGGGELRARAGAYALDCDQVLARALDARGHVVPHGQRAPGVALPLAEGRVERLEVKRGVLLRRAGHQDTARRPARVTM